MIIPGQRSLPLSVHNRSVITFTNTLFHINWLRRFSSPRETPYTHHNRQGLRIPDLRRYPSPGIGHFHTVLVVVVLVDLVAILALDRHCSATMFGVFLHCTAVLSDHMGHPQPSLSGTGVLWVSTGTHRCVDPPKQGGGSTMRQPSGCCSDAALH